MATDPRSISRARSSAVQGIAQADRDVDPVHLDPGASTSRASAVRGTPFTTFSSAIASFSTPVTAPISVGAAFCTIPLP
jgi:hypothetical protein